MLPVGVVFPQYEMELDPGAVRAFAQGVEAMGYSYVVAYDHVVGANRASRPNWQGPYDVDTSFHEPFVLFSYMIGATRSLGCFTGILILPQRQTVLVAKQAASLDVLCGGRLRLGIGGGWNEVEYQSLGIPFAGRGERMEAQIDLLRRLWTQKAVTASDAWHTVPDAGINPLPVQRPIPIWMGGGLNEKVMRRIAKSADGWIPMWDYGRRTPGIYVPDQRAQDTLAKCHGFCREYGRDPATLGLEGRVESMQSDSGHWAEAVEAWQKLGATHLSVVTLGDGLRGVDQHLRRLEEFRPTLPG